MVRDDKATWKGNYFEKMIVCVTFGCCFSLCTIGAMLSKQLTGFCIDNVKEVVLAHLPTHHKAQFQVVWHVDRRLVCGKFIHCSLYYKTIIKLCILYLVIG